MSGRDEAVETALRALRHRDRSVAEVDARLEARGLPAAERARALETLERVGYVDDARFARARAAALAERCAGDASIRRDLEGRGVAPEHVEAALAELEPEAERAARAVARRGRGARTARWLASRGFGEAAIEAAVASDGRDALG